MCCTDLYDSAFKICSFICHQKPERSFSVYGIQFILCVRCTGIWAFFAVMSIYGCLFGVGTSYRRLNLLLCAALVVNTATFIDFLDGNIIRFILGSMIGITTGLVISKSLNQLTRSNV